jgi:hypothetical protein
LVAQLRELLSQQERSEHLEEVDYRKEWGGADVSPPTGIEVKKEWGTAFASATTLLSRAMGLGDPGRDVHKDAKRFNRYRMDENVYVQRVKELLPTVEALLNRYYGDAADAGTAPVETCITIEGETPDSLRAHATGSAGSLSAKWNMQGNGSWFEVAATGGQFDWREGDKDNTPLKFTVTGVAEFKELVEFLNAVRDRAFKHDASAPTFTFDERDEWASSDPTDYRVPVHANRDVAECPGSGHAPASIKMRDGERHALCVVCRASKPIGKRKAEVTAST